MDSPSAQLIRAMRDAIGAEGDPERAAGQQAYMKSAMPYRGITSPRLKVILRAVLAANSLPDNESWSLAIRTLWDDAAYREERYAAIAVARHRHYQNWAQEPETLALYRHLIETGAWWDFVDEIASHLVGPLVRRHPDLPDLMRAWAVDEHLWVRRTAILCQLSAKEATDRQLLIDCIQPNLADRDFFIRKAIGWSLRQYAHVGDTEAQWVRESVAHWDAQLSGLSKREALKNLG